MPFSPGMRPGAKSASAAAPRSAGKARRGGSNSPALGPAFGVSDTIGRGGLRAVETPAPQAPPTPLVPVFSVLSGDTSDDDGMVMRPPRFAPLQRPNFPLGTQSQSQSQHGPSQFDDTGSQAGTQLDFAPECTPKENAVHNVAPVQPRAPAKSKKRRTDTDTFVEDMRAAMPTDCGEPGACVRMEQPCVPTFRVLYCL